MERGVFNALLVKAITKDEIEGSYILVSYTNWITKIWLILVLQRLIYEKPFGHQTPLNNEERDWGGVYSKLILKGKRICNTLFIKTINMDLVDIASYIK